VSAWPDDPGCGGEPFALRVLGDSMLPEFAEGDIIVVEPDGALHDGSFVVACVGGEWLFRQLAGSDALWRLRALNDAFADRVLPDLGAVRGVVIQKAVPGRRRSGKRYV